MHVFRKCSRPALGCSLCHIHPFTLHPCRWANHPHRVLKRATRHPRRCNGTNGNGKEEEVGLQHNASTQPFGTAMSLHLRREERKKREKSTGLHININYNVKNKDGIRVE
jgi:hypothetical protein